MNRVALDFGFIQIYWYSIIMFLGIYGFVNRYGGTHNCTQNLMQNEFLQENFIKIVEKQKENIVNIEEIVEDEQEKIIVEESKEIRKSKNNTLTKQKSEKEQVSIKVIHQEKEENGITKENNKIEPVKEQINKESNLEDYQISLEIELDKNTKFDIKDGGYAEWGHLTEEQMNTLGL